MHSLRINRSPEIVIVGSANEDLVVRAARLPRPGETVLGGGLREFFGGKGANQAVAAHRAGGGLGVAFVGKLGSDGRGTSTPTTSKPKVWMCRCWGVRKIRRRALR